MTKDRSKVTEMGIPELLTLYAWLLRFVRLYDRIGSAVSGDNVVLHVAK